VLLWFTLGHTRDAAEYARKMVDEAIKTADAAVAANQEAKRHANLTEHAFKRLERPYLFVQFHPMSTHFLKVKTPKPIVPYLTIKLVNFGKLPATLRSTSIGLLNNPEFPLISTFAVEREFYEVIEPGKDHELPRIKVTDAQMGQTFGGADATHLILYGLIRYEDPTGAMHTDSFCMRGLPGAGGFKIEDRPEYNWRKTEYPKPEPESETA
jgi:hypothetical protein